MAKVRSSLITLAPIVLLAIVIPAIAFQDPQTGPMSAPPPLKIIPKIERAQIEAETDSKNRLKLTLQFALAHLETAERHTAQTNFEAASAEVGTYHALIENALTLLASMKRDSNRTRDLYKRIELSLRAHGPKLTAMRRITPLEFAVWIKQVEDFARDGRTQALNSFYGHTVVREKNEPERPNGKPSEKPVPTPKTPQP